MIRTGMKTALSGALLGLCATAQAALVEVTEGFETITVGSAVADPLVFSSGSTSVGVSISTSNGAGPLLGNDYRPGQGQPPGTPFSFRGAGTCGANRVPCLDNPLGNPVSLGEYFVSTVVFPNSTTSPFDITFDFSAPVYSFGLTTLDLLEQAYDRSAIVALRAYDAGSNLIATDSLTGPQGTSGLNLQFLVSDLNPIITSAQLSVTSPTSIPPGYGLDNFIVGVNVPVPVPATLLLLLTGIVGLAGRRLVAS